MKFLVLLFSISFFSSSWADIQNAPRNFSYRSVSYTFVDFNEAFYGITYDVKNEEAIVKTQIRFTVKAAGRPLFDLVDSQVENALLNGMTKVEVVDVKSPDEETSYRSINKTLAPGNYSLVMISRINKLVRFSGSTVSSAFWMSDLSDRSFLEKYIPSNLDYDSYKMNFSIKVIGTSEPHNLVINCHQKLLEKNHFVAQCPSYYNSSALFYHLFPDGAHSIQKGVYKSIDNRIIPILTYGNGTNSLMRKAKEVLTELEKDYGPWPHPHLIIYGKGSGEMEYSGATMTSLWALGHEMHHSYFARAIHPAGGNAGWIDEAMASWRDDGYQSRSYYNVPTRMAGHSVYQRDTDRLAYSRGEDIIAHFDYLFQDKGGMKAFMKDWAERYLYQAMTTPRFQKHLESYFNTDLQNFFDKYIYGKGLDFNTLRKVHFHSGKESIYKINKYHQRYTDKQLESFL